MVKHIMFDKDQVHDGHGQSIRDSSGHVTCSVTITENMLIMTEQLMYDTNKITGSPIKNLIMSITFKQDNMNEASIVGVTL